MHKIGTPAAKIHPRMFYMQENPRVSP